MLFTVMGGLGAMLNLGVAIGLRGCLGTADNTRCICSGPLDPTMLASLVGGAGFTCRGCGCGIAASTLGESGLTWGIPLSGGGGGPDTTTGAVGSLSDSEADSTDTRNQSYNLMVWHWHGNQQVALTLIK